jgi:hypothetical protein
MDFKSFIVENMNPDDIYGQNARTFICHKNFIAYYATSRQGIHQDLLIALKDKYITPSLLDNEHYKTDLRTEGELPDEMEEYLAEALLGRQSFLSFGGILGRIGLMEYNIAFWNKKSKISDEEKKGVMRLFEIFQKDYKEYRYYCKIEDQRTFDNYKMYDYKDFFSNEPPVKKSWSDKAEKITPQDLQMVVHLTPPEKKAQVMKELGIKPKEAMGVQKRFAMGEQLEFIDFVGLA